ncbi:Hsp20 family protein [Lactobacillus sp. S2-2]|uniref:Hsp20/alpha crystallin family protein n=1 Tax=Lactobacillus sp. S2-2 TaxID=2692917 RepID=UPI001F4775DF|nr:Hsp20/alpha crystallin family protein [Lactobacillus sp. S2-2]MCF6515476.1 Hsp20 family protein [Lactobacillus sp. S2-2]
MSNELQSRRNYGLGFDPFFGTLQDNFFDSFLSKESSQSLKTDIQENDQNYEVQVELSGVKKDDINMNYSNGVLNIDAKKDSFTDHSDKDGNMMLSERNYGSLSRSYRLPNVNSDEINAKFENGVLKVTLPKLTKSQNTNNIEIN